MLIALLLSAAQEMAAAEDPFAKCLWIGYAIKPYGDWDKDGHADFLVSAPRKWPGGVVPTVALISGKDGHALLVLHGESGFGREVDVLDDIDDDHFPEIVVGRFGFDHDGGTQVFSGHDGKLLYALAGSSFVTIPDVNDDHRADFVVLTLHGDATKLTSTTIELRSGVDGTPIRKLLERKDDDVLALGIADCNGDGCGDVVVGFTSRSPGTAPFAEVDLISGRDGATLAQHKFDVSCTEPSIALADVGELDRTGKPQIAVSLFYDLWSDWIDGHIAPLPPGDVFVLSTPSLKTRLTLEAKDAKRCNGKSLSGGGDVNGDGHSDLLVTEYPDFISNESTPRVRLYSGLDGSLLRTRTGGVNFGRTVSWIGDIDADGTPDYAVAALYDRDGTELTENHVEVFSGKTGAQLLSLPTSRKR